MGEYSTLPEGEGVCDSWSKNATSDPGWPSLTSPFRIRYVRRNLSPGPARSGPESNMEPQTSMSAFGLLCPRNPVGTDAEWRRGLRSGVMLEVIP